LWNRVVCFWKQKETQIETEVLKPIRRTVDTQSIRNRISVQGWLLREVPVKRNHPDPALREVLQWKVTAVKGSKSIEVSGKTIDEAMKSIGQTLGVIAR
jgi:hypothetical protein